MAAATKTTTNSKQHNTSFVIVLVVVIVILPSKLPSSIVARSRNTHTEHKERDSLWKLEDDWIRMMRIRNKKQEVFLVVCSLFVVVTNKQDAN